MAAEAMGASQTALPEAVPPGPEDMPAGGAAAAPAQTCGPPHSRPSVAQVLW